MTTTTGQLYAALEQSCSQVPYAVTRTQDGFRVELDLFTAEVTQRAQRLGVNRTDRTEPLALLPRNHRLKA